MTKSVHISKIDWCTHTCNIITGCLGPYGNGERCKTPEGGDYCYAEPFANRIYRKPLGEGNEFKPHFWEERLDGIHKEKDARIFMNSMGDALGDWVPKEWILKMLLTCAGNPSNEYYFLTKNPKRYFSRDIYKFFKNNKNFWAGFTAETGTLFMERFGWYIYDPKIQTFVSIEPIFDGRHVLHMHGYHPKWVIVGAQTKPDRYPAPAWIVNIRQQCEILNIPLFEKNSLDPMNLPGGLIQQIPGDV
ncbi:MAG: DUF5131 family protein [Gammaproteobacteria bacterium]|nr:DUF5131 family protein [Gammaproteobacteria bacterium]